MTLEETAPVQTASSEKPVDYLHPICRRSRLICLITTTAAVISVCYSLTLPNIYTAKAMLLPIQEDKGLATSMLAQLGGLANIAAGALSTSNSADLYLTLLKSETIRDRVIDRFKLMDVFGKKYRSDLYLVLDMTVNATVGRKDGVISISVDDRDPKRAADIANAFVDELQKVTIRLNASGAGNNRLFLEGRLATARADLSRAEEDFRAFQSKNKAVQINEQAKATIEGASRLRSQLAAAEAELATLRQRFTDSSQEVKRLSATIASLRRQAATMEGGSGKGAIPQLGSMPQLGQEYVRLMREIKIQESMVELLTKQFEMARFSEAKDVSPIQVLQKARAPEKKSRPSRAKLVIKSTVLALFFSVLLAFGLENIARMPAENRDYWKNLLRQLPLIGRFAR